MYGRGRGTYLGLLLESQIGKNAAVSNTADTASTAKSEKQSVATAISSPHGPDDGKKSPSPTWTSLDLLGNRGRRVQHGSDSVPKPNQVNSDDSQTRNFKDVLDQKPKMHLVTPEEFLSPPHVNSNVEHEPKPEIAQIDTSSENSESNVGSTSRYIPPHLRKGFAGKPEIYLDPAVTRYKKLDAPTSTGTAGSHTSQTMAESELNWQKWKLQRSFKKLLINLSVENFAELSVNIRNICEESQLSTKFPGTSEVNALVDLLVSRVIDQKDSFEVVVQICRILNALYKDEFPANLKDVLRQHRQETFSGVGNKNVRCENFCIFLGKLCDIAKDETKSFQDCLRQSVLGCLHDWISPFQTAEECLHEAEVKVTYLCYLLDVTKSVLITEKGSWIKSCFGKIKNCLLSEKVTRSVKESLLDHVIKCSLQSSTTKESNTSLPSSKTATESSLPGDPYKNVKIMLSDLELSHLLEKFHDNLIRDTLLCAEKNELKNTLQEAGFAPGAVLEVQLYLDKHSGTFDDSVADNIPPAKPGRQEVDPQTRVKNLENDLKEILSKIESERKKQEKEKEYSKSEVESDAPLDMKELQSKLMTYQNSLEKICPPPPGFSYPEEENLTAPTDLVPMREVSLGARKNNIIEFKDENTQAGNPVVNLSQNDGKRNFLDRASPKYKGRGRGRRDATGTLENAKDYGEFQGFSGDARGSRWNSRDMKGFQHMPVRDYTGYLQWSKNDSSETSRKNYDRPPGDFRDTKGYYDRQGYPDETNGPTTKGNLDAETADPREFVTESTTSSSADFGAVRGEFGSSMPIGCFICGGKDHRSAYCKNNAAMFD